MDKGDLSNKVSPRCLLVFEGALAFCTNEAKSSKLIAKRRDEKALKEYWVLNEHLCRRILWLFHKKDITFEVVTFLGQQFAVELRYWLDSLDIPVHRVWATTPAALGRNIAYMPDLAFVYDPEPERWLMYGTKGVFLSDVNQVGDFYRV